MKPNFATPLLLSLVMLSAPALAEKAPAAKGPVQHMPPVAAPPPAPTAPTLAESLTGDAKADYESAKLLYVDGDFGGALMKFTSAHEKSSDVRLLWNIASCEKSQRHYANVLRLVRQYLQDGDAVLTASDKDEARALIAAIEPLTAMLKVSVDTPGADVYLDDVLVGQSPLEKSVTVDIGMRKVRVKKADYKEFAKEIPVGGSPEIAVQVALAKIIHEGKIFVRAGSKDDIFVDGKLVGAGTWTGVVPSGGHVLRVSSPEMRAYQSEVLISDNETRNVSITLEKEIKSGSPVPAWVWIGGGALLLSGAVVGGYFLFRPDDKQPALPTGTLDPGSVQASVPGFRFR